MKITEIIFEDQETDEGVGAAIGRGLGAVGKGIGAVAAVPQGIGKAIKKGYQSGVATIAGDNAAATPAQPAATPQATATTMKQITAAVPALRTRDLQSLKKTVDAALAAKAKAPTQPATGATTPTMTPVTGGRAPAVR